MSLDPMLARAIELARELPVDVPALAHRDQVRTALLARAEAPIAGAPRRRARYAIAVVGAVAAIAIAYLSMSAMSAMSAVSAPADIAAAPHAHGHVHAHEHALLGSTTPSPDEVVRLRDGTIDVDVDPLGPGDRFRVIVGASEIEVRGTAFTVVAAHDQLVGVTVAHGRVEVRPANAPPTVLGAGASWQAPAVESAVPIAMEHATDTAPPIVVVETPHPPAVAPPPRASKPAVSPAALDQLAYNDAWAALREHRFHAAGVAFDRALALAPDGSLADDARFWHAVALAREPRHADAIRAFRELLDEHPGSAHHGEASAMLGWLLVDAKELGEARTRFEAAAADPSDKVRASASAGLAALR